MSSSCAIWGQLGSVRDTLLHIIARVGLAGVLEGVEPDDAFISDLRKRRALFRPEDFPTPLRCSESGRKSKKNKRVREWHDQRILTENASFSLNSVSWD